MSNNELIREQAISNKELVCLIEQTVKEVDCNYYNWENPHDFLNSNNIQYGERVFCYEFYHHLKKHLFESNEEPFPPLFTSYRLDGEIGKNMDETIFTEIAKNILGRKWKNAFNTNRSSSRKLSGVIPDLVIHERQANRYTGQKCIIEVKSHLDTTIKQQRLSSSTIKSIQRDITKLVYGIEQWNYELGIFICINNKFDSIAKCIRENFSHSDIKMETYSRIYVIGGNHGTINKSRLSDILGMG